jgi:hypothetical protein
MTSEMPPMTSERHNKSHSSVAGSSRAMPSSKVRDAEKLINRDIAVNDIAISKQSHPITNV